MNPQPHPAPDPDPDQLLTAREACALLRICDKHLRKLCQADGLPVVRLGRRTLFRRQDLRDWLQRQTLQQES